jgi:hypothetical protein
MALPPTELGMLVEGKSAEGMFKALKKNGCLTSEGLNNRREIIEALKLKIKYPQTTMLPSTDGGPIRFPALGGETFEHQIIGIFNPYLTEKGHTLARTIAKPRVEQKHWWEFWK